jgi:hypothetical protein
LPFLKNNYQKKLTIKGAKTMSEDINAKIEYAREQARLICEEKGVTHPECAVAWDIVEGLQAEASHQHSNRVEKSSLQTYCEANPGDLECKIFDD